MLANHLPSREEIYLVLILEINTELKYQMHIANFENKIVQVQKEGAWPIALNLTTSV